MGELLAALLDLIGSLAGHRKGTRYGPRLTRSGQRNMTAGERCGLVLLVAACGVEVLFDWLGVALVLLALAVAVGGRSRWRRHRGRGVI